MTAGAELSDDLHADIERLCAHGDELAQAGAFDEAIGTFRQALARLPAPAEHWDAALWITVAIGDTQFLKGDHPAALDTFQSALMLPEGLENPFIHLRLGQCAFELGDTRRAGNGLMGAYMLAGPEIFEEDDPKYLRYLATIARDIDTSGLPTA